jgi:hypothetical protein
MRRNFHTTQVKLLIIFAKLNYKLDNLIIINLLNRQIHNLM